jgi:hypothetical protein
VVVWNVGMFAKQSCVDKCIMVEHCLSCAACRGLLEGRTRLLVTHQLQYLPSADVVVVMSGEYGYGCWSA